MHYFSLFLITCCDVTFSAWKYYYSKPLKTFHLSLRYPSNYLNISKNSQNIFADYVSFRNSVLLFLLYFTVFLLLNLNSHKRTNNTTGLSFFLSIIKMWLRASFYRILLSGDVQINPGLQRNSGHEFSIKLRTDMLFRFLYYSKFCYGNLHSISSHEN